MGYQIDGIFVIGKENIISNNINNINIFIIFVYISLSNVLLELVAESSDMLFIATMIAQIILVPRP